MQLSVLRPCAGDTDWRDVSEQKQEAHARANSQTMSKSEMLVHFFYVVAHRPSVGCRRLRAKQVVFKMQRWRGCRT